MAESLWIIDGNNVIRRDASLDRARRSGGWLAARRMLESQLHDFRRRRMRGQTILVVYDGVPDPDAPKLLVRGIRVAYPPHERTADDVILNEVREAEGRREVHVVTSDRADIGHLLRGTSTHWHTSEEFLEVLRPTRSIDRGDRRNRGDYRTGGGSRTGRVTADPDDLDGDKPPPPRGREVDRWLDAFSDDEPERREES